MNDMDYLVRPWHEIVSTGWFTWAQYRPEYRPGGTPRGKMTTREKRSKVIRRATRQARVKMRMPNPTYLIPGALM